MVGIENKKKFGRKIFRMGDYARIHARIPPGVVFVTTYNKQRF